MKSTIFLSALVAIIFACTSGPIPTPTATPDRPTERLEPAEIESLKLYLVLTTTPIENIAGSLPAILELAALRGDGLVSEQSYLVGEMIADMVVEILDFYAVEPPDRAIEYHELTFDSLKEIQRVLIRLGDFYREAEDVNSLSDREVKTLGNTHTDISRQLRDAFENFSNSVHDRTKLYDLVDR